jgi:hypothetical protein
MTQIMKPTFVNETFFGDELANGHLIMENEYNTLI